MNINFNVKLLDETKPVLVSPTSLTIYLPDDVDLSQETVRIAVEAKEISESKKITIYREVDLPSNLVQNWFTLNGLKINIIPEAVNVLLAAFNYEINTAQNESINTEN